MAVAQSASISSTRLPLAAITAAKLADTKDLPRPCVGPANITMLFLKCGIANLQAARKLRRLSTAHLRE
jgi:hypothetical protein